MPIYKKAMDLAIHVVKILRSFSRYHKYTLGAELRQQSCEIVTLVIATNSRPDKAPLLLQLRQDMEALQVLLRIAKEVCALGGWSCSAVVAPGRAVGGELGFAVTAVIAGISFRARRWQEVAVRVNSRRRP